MRFLPGCGFCGDVTFVHRLVRQHRLANDIADGKNVWHVGAHLRVHIDEAAIRHHDTRTVRADFLAIRRTTDAHQHHVVAHGFFGCAFTFEGDINAILLCLHADRFGFQHDAVKAFLVHFLPDLDQIAIRARHQAIEHFHHIEARSQRGIHGAHFEADDAAADDQHFLRNFFERQCAGRIDNARIIGNEWQAHHLRASRDDGFVEADDFFLAGFFLTSTGGDFNRQVVGIEKLTDAAHHLDLAHFRHAAESAG